MGKLVWGGSDRLRAIERVRSVTSTFRRNLLLAAVTGLLATSLTQVAAAPQPRLSVKPATAVVGAKVTITGMAFAPGETGTIELDAAGSVVATYAASSKGSFKASFVVAQPQTGSHRLTAFRIGGSARTERASATITVVEASTSSPTAAPTAAPTAPGSGTEPTSAPTASAAPTVPSSGATNVRAYYYLWWSTRHWVDKLGPTYPYDSTVLPLPATTDADGCNETSLFVGNQLVDVPGRLTSQNDPGVIEGDVRTAKAAGLAGFILNWAGNGQASQTTGSTSYTPRLVEALASSVRVGGFTNWVSYKTSSLPSVSYILGDLQFLVRDVAASPGWARIDGKPVLVLTGSRKYSDADLSVISSYARNHFYFVGDESSATLTVDRLALFDAISYYWSSQNPWTNTGSFYRLTLMADLVHRAGKLWFAPITPGYNSRLIGGSTCVPRREGATLDALWTGNSRSRPDGWTVISWNEVAENTHIQPMTKWGDGYLHVLSRLIGG